MGTLTLVCVISLIISITSLPINKDKDILNLNAPPDLNVKIVDPNENGSDIDESTESNQNSTVINPIDILNTTSKNVSRNVVRPGIIVSNYAVEIEPDVGSGMFRGRLVAQVNVIDIDTLEDPIIFHARDLAVQSVQFSFAGGSVFNPADFDVDEDDGIIEISTGFPATLYTLVIEYTGSLDVAGSGLFVGEYGTDTYLAMNLHATHARSVFPCIDEPSEATTITFTFNGLDYNNMVMNSMLVDGSQEQFRPLQGPPHVWGMVAHNFNNINIPTANVLLFGRQGVANQDAQASVAINFYFHNLNEWTNKDYFEIVVDQDGRMLVLALPDISRDWYALSTVCIWEPYIFMETTHSVTQRKTALIKIAEAMARQWFGYVIHPENWRYQWVTTGLNKYAAFEMAKAFQTDPLQLDVTLIDMNTIFVTDIIQESLLRDSYVSSRPLEPDDDLFEEEEIRDHVNGLVQYKAPAILRMLRLILGDEDQDFIQLAARALLNSRALQTVNSLNFYDAINSEWLFTGNQIVDDVLEFLEPWVDNTGYPLIHVGLRQGGILLTQERFSLSPTTHENFVVLLSFTTSVNPNFEDENIYPRTLMEATTTINMALDEEDWVIFNIQGQGYYRVNYDGDLWERIIWALEDPERREEIHPLNRATLVDDALNLARAGKLDYDVAFQVVLTMEHETEYAPWKAFVRNMDFLRKRLVALVTEDDDLDPDIYLRMVRRTVGLVEDEIGFYPDPMINEPAMVTLTRGLVMDHACRANYAPCIAAAIDWFFDPNNNDVVNPNIPHEIRPAVYCTMAREGDGDIISALYDRMELEVSQYERLVILESLACSQDEGFISTFLAETIAINSPYGVEERSKIFAAVAESSFQNAQIAVNFMSMRTNEIRDMYGGPEKLEELIFILVDNLADDGLTTDFMIWVNSINNNLMDSQDAAERARDQALESLVWENAHMEYVYEWIDENDASTIILSSVLILMTLIITIFNH